MNIPKVATMNTEPKIRTTSITDKQCEKKTNFYKNVFLFIINIHEMEISIANFIIIIFFIVMYLMIGYIYKYGRKSLTQFSPNHYLFDNYMFKTNEL